MMLVFLDTEFTDLKPGAKLISIALVDENEEFFYAELTDTYTRKDCSTFVKHHVLPFLRGEEYQMSWHECALRIGNWIESRNKRCIIANDNPGWDMPYLNDLLSPLWPSNLESLILPIQISSVIAEGIVIENNYDIHNALHDALVMKKAMDLQKNLKD
jgi:hypothetical protein